MESLGLTAKSKILLVCDSRENAEQLLARAAESHEVVVRPTRCAHWPTLRGSSLPGFTSRRSILQEAFELGKLLQNEQILEGMPDGVVLLG